MTPLEANKQHMMCKLKAAGVVIVEAASGAIHLHRGQRRITVTDVNYLDSADLRALGVLPNMTAGRMRING